MEFWIMNYGDNMCLYCNDYIVATFVNAKSAETFSKHFNVEIRKQ